MSLTSYRAAPPRVNRALYLINGLADGKEMLGAASCLLRLFGATASRGAAKGRERCPSGNFEHRKHDDVSRAFHPHNRRAELLLSRRAGSTPQDVDTL